MPLKGLKDQQRKLKKFYTHLQNDIPKIVGAEAVKFFRNSFQEQGWTDVTEEPWKKHSPKTKLKKGSFILIQSGKLMRSIHVEKVMPGAVIVVASMPYAKVHNEGFEGTVNIKKHVRNTNIRVMVKSSSMKTKKLLKPKLQKFNIGNRDVKAHNRKMNIPKRQYMGESEELNMIMKMAILKHGDKLWNKL